MGIKYNSAITETPDGGYYNGNITPGAFNAWDYSNQHIGNRVYEPQRLNNFELLVDFDASDMVVEMGGGSASPMSISSDKAEKELRLNVISSFVPHFTQEVIEVKRGNSMLRYAGTASYDTGSIKVQDMMGSEAKLILTAWQQMSYNPRTEKVGLAQNYKKTATLFELTPDGQVVRKWKIYGLWISKISESEYDHAGGQNSVQEVTVDMQYDKSELVFDASNEGAFNTTGVIYA